MKKIVYRIIKIAIVFICIFAVVFVGQKYFFQNYDGDKVRVDGFYLEDKNSLDVVFLGASEIFSDYSASLAYKECGFTSYPVCVSSNPVSLMKYELKEILKYQSPKLLVVEVNSALYDDDTFTENEADKRRFVDAMPLSVNKIDAAINTYQSDLLSYIIPFAKYHSNWTDYHSCIDCAKNVFNMEKRGYSLLKGNLTCSKIEPFECKKDLKNDNSSLPLNNRLNDYFIDFLEYCKSENINNILFVRFPHAIVKKDAYERFQRTNYIETLVKKYGYDFVNFEKKTEEIGIDFKKDFYNADHMNIYGQKKFTEYISKFMVNNYLIGTSALSNKQKEQWNQCKDYYNKFYKYADENIIAKNELWIRESNDIISKLSSYK